MLDRRHFLSSATGLAASLALGNNLFAQLEKAPSSLPEPDLYQKNEEAYWLELRKQFLIPADEVYLNNGTVGSSPAPVLRAIFDGYNQTEKMDQQDPEDYPIWGYAAWNEFRDPLAQFLGCERDELAIRGLKFCWCPAGRFIMGSPPNEPERRPGEDQVEVTLTRGFWMGKYGVTQAQWKRIVGELFDLLHDANSVDLESERRSFSREGFGTTLKEAIFF